MVVHSCLAYQEPASLLTQLLTMTTTNKLPSLVIAVVLVIKVVRLGQAHGRGQIPEIRIRIKIVLYLLAEMIFSIWQIR